MRNYQREPLIPTSGDGKQRIDRGDFPNISYGALFLRIIPLTISFLLFTFAASADVKKWSSSTIQMMLGVALVLGVLGLAVFIPKRVKHLK